MKTRGWRMEDGGWPTHGVLDCGGKSDATPLWEHASNLETTGNHSPCESTVASDLPAQSKTWRNLVASLIFLAAALTAHAQSYSIDWHTIDGGGGTSTGGVYSVSGTIGQPDAGGPMTNGQYSVMGGFWALPTAIQVIGAPTLAIISAGAGQATISWTPNTPGFVLQETGVLSPANWTNSLSGATNPVVVPASLPTKFYRLFKP